MACTPLKWFVQGFPQPRKGYVNDTSNLKRTILQDRDTGKSREFGFVTFNNPYEAQEAINQMNQTQIGGSHVDVHFANTRPSSNSSGQFHSYLGESHISYPIDQSSSYGSGYGSGYGSSGGGYGGNQYQGGYY
ncbi:hypothetical protein BDW72DRAFT_198175 [Aspergillus terricola var. indicus]